MRFSATPSRVLHVCRLAAASPGRRRAGALALVTNSASGTVTPVSLSTGKARPAIRVGANPVAIAVDRRRHTAYVVNHGSNSVTPIDTATLRPKREIRVGAAPTAV